MTRITWTVETLVDHLHHLGVRPGDALMVHASMRAVGPVDGAAGGLVAAIDRALHPGGSWTMVLGTEPAGPGVVFDAATSPADPDVGVLAEVFRTTTGTVANHHPEARFGVRGPAAATWLRDLPWDDYYGPGSVLERLHAAGARILRLGADLDTVTMLHYAEYLVPLPSKRRVRRESVVRDPATHTTHRVVVECLDDSDGIVEWPGEDYFAVIIRAYLSAGRALAVGPVGGATAELLDARDLVAFAVEWMAAHLGPLAR